MSERQRRGGKARGEMKRRWRTRTALPRWGLAAAWLLATVLDGAAQGPRARPHAHGASAKSTVLEERMLFRSPVYELKWDGEYLRVHSRAMAGEGKDDTIVTCDLRFLTQDQGYVSERKIVSMSVETSRPPPRAASAEPRIRMRLEIEKKARLDVDLRCGTNSIAMEFDYKPPPSGDMMVWHGAVRLPMLTVAGEGEASGQSRPPPEMCRGMAIEMVERGGRVFMLPYGDAIADPPDASRWALRGVWPGWIVRAQAEGRDDFFRYWQLHGERPVDGCGLIFGLENRAVQRRLTLSFEREGAGGAPAPPAPGRGR